MFPYTLEPQAKTKLCYVYGNPTDPNFLPDPKVFFKIFLFLIKSCIMLFVVCQTRLGSLGVFYELESLQHSTKYEFISFTVPFLISPNRCWTDSVDFDQI